MTWDRWLPRILWVSSLGSSLRPEHAEMYRKHETSNRTTQEMHKMSNKSADTWNIMKLNLFHFFKTWKISSKLPSTTVWCSMMQYDAVWCSEAVAMTDGPSVWSLWLIKMILFILSSHEDFSPTPLFHPMFHPHPPKPRRWHHSWEALHETTMRTTSRNHRRTLSGHPAGSVKGTNWRTFFVRVLVRVSALDMLHTTAGRPRQIQSTGWTCSWATLLSHCPGLFKMSATCNSYQHCWVGGACERG